MAFGLIEYIVPSALMLVFVIYFFLGRFLTDANVFAPWNVTIGVWFVIVFMLLMWGDLLYPVKGPFYAALACWVSGFFFSSVFSYKLSSAICRFEPQEFRVNKLAFYCLLVLSVLVTPIYFYRVYVALGGVYSNLFMALRENAVSNLELGVIKYVKELDMLMLVVVLWAYPKINKLLLAYFLLINFLLGVAIMEKGTFFYIMITIMYVLYSKKYITQKSIAITFGVFLALSFVFNMVRSNKLGEGDFLGFFSVYILSPSVAFETLTPCSGDYWGANTFPFFYHFVNFFADSEYEIVMKLKEFVFVPLPTNVFTVMQPYYEDFGYIGVFVFGIINGAIFGWIYRRAVTQGPIAMCVYAYVLEILMLQFFQENFIVSMSVFIQICFWSFLLVGRRWFTLSTKTEVGH